MRKMRWYQSLFVKFLGFTFLAIALGFCGILLLQAQSLDALSNLVYDKKIQVAIKASAKNYVTSYKLQQKLLLERLHIHVPKQASLQEFRQQCQKAKADLPFLQESFEISSNTDRKPDGWMNRTTLKFRNFQLKVSDQENRKVMQGFNKLLQRYLLLGKGLHSDITDAFLKSTAQIATAGFFFLGILLLWLTQRFKRQVQALLEAISQWSKGELSHRIKAPLTNEILILGDGLNQMANDLEALTKKNLQMQKISSWQTMAKKIAHEIKNPLTPIQMMASQLRSQYQDGKNPQFSELLEKSLGIFEEEVTHLRRLVVAFQDFSSLPAPQKKPVDLVELANDVIIMQSAAFPQHQFANIGKAPTATVPCDRGLIKQVFINLTKNACESQAEPALKIAFDIHLGNNSMMIDISDTGPGIPKSIEDNLFEAYVTSKPNMGMGLGLTICQKIIWEHGGEILVKRQDSQTIFSISLPLTLEENRGTT